MADGRIEGGNIVCGLHDWDYCYKSGISYYNSSERLHRFNAWVEDGKVWVDEDEIKAWADAGVSVCSDEKVRLAWMGNALWSNTGFYRAFEESHGAVFVWSMYTNFLAKGYIRYFEGDPMRALAARHISMNELLHLPPWMADWVLHEAGEMGAQGVVNLVPIGDRLSANGTLLAKLAIEKAGLPVLDISANMVDARAWDKDQMEAKVGNFIDQNILSA